MPPLDEDPSLSTAYNEQLRELAKARGWTFVDSMAKLRENERYAPGMTSDGIHPTADGVKAIAAALAPAIAKKV